MRVIWLPWACLISVSGGWNVQAPCAGSQKSLKAAHTLSGCKFSDEVNLSNKQSDARTLCSALESLAKLLGTFNPTAAYKGHYPVIPCASSVLKLVPSRVHKTAKMTVVEADTMGLPFYTDPELSRDRMRVLQGGSIADLLAAPTARIVLSQDGKIFGVPPSDAGDDVDAVFLTGEEIAPSWLESATSPDGKGEVVWVGAKDDIDFYVLDVPAGLDVELPPALQARGVVAQPVRQFGDRLRSRGEAAVLATANGMVNFHRSHKFCAKCGSHTRSAKLGACRRCSNTDCGSSVYPRIDPSAIMLVVSPRQVDGGAHVLLGRKKRWPRGRYSTLAGFTEVGESVEDCLVREVLEESGVAVDRASVQFVASQPWPFPRSLMLGFRAHAVAPEGASTLPAIDDSIEELEDVKWFSRDYVRKRLEGGSTALDYNPTEAEAEFHVPGKASLARNLISEWANEQP